MNPKLFHVQTAAGVIPVRLEVATTEESRQRGLMERFFLPDRYGMLFVWPRPWQIFIWMKSTYVDLDVLFLDEAGRIQCMKSGKKLDLRPIVCDRLSKFVVELPMGTCEKYGIRVGDVIL
jgi:uncharacterized membrane protein (UPF0127 family)